LVGVVTQPPEFGKGDPAAAAVAPQSLRDRAAFPLGVAAGQRAEEKDARPVSARTPTPIRAVVHE